MVDNCTQFIQSLLYPPTCVLCARNAATGLDLCSDCRAELPYQGPACPVCGIPLRGTDARTLCGRCQRRPPSFDRTFALFRFAPPVDGLVRSLKFRQKLACGRILGTLLASALAADNAPLPDLLVPVPLHARRQRQRGYNQALELTRPVARRLGVPVAARRCRRVRETAAQAELDAGDRGANVRGAFAWRGPPPPLHVAIVDDVVTTGHTVEEVARVLRRLGAQRVEVWCAARA